MGDPLKSQVKDPLKSQVKDQVTEPIEAIAKVPEAVAKKNAEMKDGRPEGEGGGEKSKSELTNALKKFDERQKSIAKSPLSITDKGIQIVDSLKDLILEGGVEAVNLILDGAEKLGGIFNK